MFIKRHYKVRSAILRILAEYQDKFSLDVKAKERLMHFSEIKKHLQQYGKNYLLDNLQYLTDTNEIYCSMELDDSKFCILKEGRISYIEEKYVLLGRNELRNYIYDVLKIISTAILLFIATYTFIQNIYQTQLNKKDIKQLKEELHKIKST